MPLRDRVRQCNDAMPPGVKCARSTMLSLSPFLSPENQRRAHLSSTEVQTGFGRATPSLASYAFVLAAPPCSSPISPPPSFSFSHAGAESIKPLARTGTRSSYSSGSLSRRKIYVNRHVDTCSNVTGARARAERNEEGTWEEAWKSGYWYAVSDFAVFLGESEGESRREERTPRDAT